MGHERTGSVTRDIAADPMTVWSAVSDITRMGEWSPECHTCEWQEGHDGPTVGARFDGHNRNGDKEWSTHAEIDRCEPGVAFHFKAMIGHSDFHFANWRYDLEAIDGGTRVTESWDDLRPEEALERSQEVSGVGDRSVHNNETASTTLERLAAALEC